MSKAIENLQASQERAIAGCDGQEYTESYPVVEV